MITSADQIRHTPLTNQEQGTTPSFEQNGSHTAWAAHEISTTATSNPNLVATVSDASKKLRAISQFKKSVIEKYHLADFSPMPIDLILKPLENYSEQEIGSFTQDFLRLTITMKQASNTSTAVVTAGAPGSGKSEHFIQLSQAKNYALLDFDRLALPSLTPFNQFLRNHEGPQFSEQGYEKYRAASQVLHNCLFAFALSQKLDIALAITSTSPYFKNTIEFLKRHKEHVEIHHMTCPTPVRIASNEARNAKGNFQCTSDNFKEKGEDFYKKTAEYLEQPDIKFFYRGLANEGAILAATTTAGTFMMNNQAALDLITTTHQAENGESGKLLQQYIEKTQERL